MKIIGLDNRTYTLTPKSSPRSNASQLHLQGMKLLSEMFPFSRLYQEVSLPSTRLFADIMILPDRIIVELNGRQHLHFVPHFHKTKSGFLKAQYKDRQKEEWVEKNGFTLIKLNWDEIDNWKEIIERR